MSFGHGIPKLDYLRTNNLCNTLDFRFLKKEKYFFISWHIFFCGSNICQTKLLMVHKPSVEQHLKFNIILFSARPCILTKSIFSNGVSGFKENKKGPELYPGFLSNAIKACFICFCAAFHRNFCTPHYRNFCEKQRKSRWNNLMPENNSDS